MGPMYIETPIYTFTFTYDNARNYTHMHPCTYLHPRGEGHTVTSVWKKKIVSLQR